MATYLVTGGCGFMGSQLAGALLKAGHTVRILDDLSTGRLECKPAAAELLIGDVSIPQQVEEAMHGIDGCFHIAAVASVEPCHLDWLHTRRVNLTGSITVFDVARRISSRERRRVPVVYASSAAVYGNDPHTPQRESGATRPLSAYGADKLASEQYAFVAGHVHGLPTCGLRFFNVYGPRLDSGSSYSGAISIFCNRLKSGRGITIFGNGEQSRDFVFIGDAVTALLAALKRTSISSPIYNVCTGHATKIRELAGAIADILGVQAQITFEPPRAGEIGASLGDPFWASRAGFEAQVGLEKGLIEILSTD
jgi:UDP-glucose 4-epimerase